VPSEARQRLGQVHVTNDVLSFQRPPTQLWLRFDWKRASAAEMTSVAVERDFMPCIPAKTENNL
jgi:hypothetical protein